jgi:hypothetical protein
MKYIYTTILLSIFSVGFGQEIILFEKSDANVSQKSFYDTSVVFCHYNIGQGIDTAIYLTRNKSTFDINGNLILDEIIDDNDYPLQTTASDFGVNNELLVVNVFGMDTITNSAYAIASIIDSLFYDTSFNLILRNNYLLDSLGGHAWYENTEYTYNSLNDIEKTVVKRLNNGLLRERLNKTYTYDIHNLVDIQTDSIIQDTLGGVYLMITDYNRNSTGRLFETIRGSMDSLGVFIPNYRIEYFYDVNGKEILNITKVYNVISSSFELRSKDELFYDAFGKLDSILHNHTVGSGVVMFLTGRSRFGYDSDGDQVYFIKEGYQGIGAPWKLCCSDGICDYTLGSKEIEFSDLSIYPNPTGSIINIQNLSLNSKIKIFNILGAQLFDAKVVSGAFQIDLNQFGEKGIYLLYILDEDSKLTTTKKVVLN